MLLSVMMVYKYWDSITVSIFGLVAIGRLLTFTQKEDLEFSVGSKAAVWEVKDPLLAGAGTGGMDYSTEEDNASNYHGGGPASLVGGVSGGQLYGAPHHQAYGGPQKGAMRGYPPSAGDRY